MTHVDIPDALQIARAIYARSASGCCLHLALDDYNVDHTTVRELANRAECDDCLELARCLVLMSKTQRLKLINSLHARNPMDTEITRTLSTLRPHPHQLLDEWLDKVNSRSLWAKNVSSDLSIEAYRVGVSTVIVTRHPRGWDIFTSNDSIMIPTTLRDAERRLSLVATKAPADFKVGTCSTGERFVAMMDLRVRTSTEPRHLEPDEAEALGLALIKAADSARDPRNRTSE